MKKYVMYLGLKVDNIQKITTKKAIKKVSGIITRYFTGCTISKNIGFWYDEKLKKTIKENSLKIEIMTEKNIDFIKDIATYIKKVFNQKSIIVEIENNYKSIEL